MTAIGTQDDELDDEWQTWLLFEVGVPIGVLILSWLGAVLGFDIKNAFLSTFASGDLLPVTTVVLLGCVVEADHFLIYASSSGQRRTAQRQKNINIAIVILVACIFGLMKGAGLSTLDRLGSSDAPQTVWYDVSLYFTKWHVTNHEIKLWAFAVFSFLVAALQVLLAYYSKTEILDLRLQGRSNS